MNKVPVIQTIAESYRFILGSLGKVIGLIWLPVLVLTVGSYFTLVQAYSTMPAALESGDVNQQGMLALRMLGFDLVMIVLVAMIAVAITREIMSPSKDISYIHFSLGLAELRVIAGFLGLFMLLVAFVVALALIGAGLSVAAASLPGAAGGSLLAAVQLIGVLALLYAMVRLSFLAVPAAVAEGNFGVESSWKLTGGNFWRIVAVGMAALLPLAIVCMGIAVIIVGQDFASPAQLPQDAAALARLQAAQMRQLSPHLPMLVGLGFLFAPLTYGLIFAPAAFAYRALKAKASAAPPK